MTVLATKHRGDLWGARARERARTEASQYVPKSVKYPGATLIPDISGEELSEQMGVTRARIGQLEHEGIRKLGRKALLRALWSNDLTVEELEQIRRAHARNPRRTR